jgi:hypothetical protein
MEYDYKIPWIKKLKINNEEIDCSLCKAGFPAEARYNHPVYGNPDNPSEVTAYFNTRYSREELGLPKDGKIFSIGVNKC